MNPPPAPAANPLSPQRSDQWRWAIWSVTAAFGSYFCMYGFRKPFTAAGFDGSPVGEIGFKTILIASQVCGYMLAKMIGIKVIAEMPRERRASAMLWLVLLAELSLLAFGFLPRPWNAAGLFFNGLSLGMVFGLVLGFLEGRRLTELLAAGLCASFILADGVTKTVGTWLLERGVSEDWMPAAAGAIFLLPFGVCVAMLARVPPPSLGDIAARSERGTMSKAQRRAFLRRYAPGLVPLVLTFLAVTIARSIRSDFAPEIWEGLGSKAAPATFTYSETLIALGVVAVNGAAVLIVDNRRAFLASLATCGLGLVLMTVSLLGYRGGWIGSFPFMVMLGLGLYLPYVAFHTTIFERMLSLTRERGNIGFLMYVADSVGYLGFIAVMFARNFGPRAEDWLGLLALACWLTIGISSVCLAMGAWYFARLHRGDAPVSPEPVSTAQSSPSEIGESDPPDPNPVPEAIL